MHPPRKMPASQWKKIKEELDNMEKAEVIRKIDEPAEWINSVVIVEKPSGGLRIRLDPRDFNKQNIIKIKYCQLPTFENIASRFIGAKCKQKILADTT